VGSCRREILDHVIALNEQHLRRLIRDYVNYHHEDRTHDSLEKDTPNRRPVELRPSPYATVISIPRLGGLQTSLCMAQSGIERQPILSPWTVVAITTEGNAVAFVAEPIQSGS
jgi:hypothetical protein